MIVRPEKRTYANVATLKTYNGTENNLNFL